MDKKIIALFIDYLYKTNGYIPDGKMWEKLKQDVEKITKDG